MKNDAQATASSGRWLPLPCVVLFLSLLFTLGASYYITTVNRAKNLARFNSATDQTENTIRDFLNSYIAILRGGAGLFAASRDVDEEEFRAFFERLRTQESFARVRGLGFAKRVLHSEREAFEKEMQGRGKTDFQIWPEGERSEYFPVVYLEPMDWRNQRAIGYDMFSDPVRRAAMIRAKRGTALSGKVLLVQETEQDPQAGFLIYVGTYKPGRFPTNTLEREQKLVGFVYSPFRADDFFLGIFGKRKAPVHLEIYDGIRADPVNLLHRSSDPIPPRPLFTSTKRFFMAGQTWTIVNRTTVAFEKTLDRSNIFWILLAGLLVSGALFSVTFFLSKAWLRTEESEARLLRERELLRASEELHRTIAETAADAIVTIDEQSIIITVNRAAERIFGYKPEEMIGQSLTMVMPERMRAQHESGLKQYLTTSETHIPWGGVELPGLHKSGREIPLEISFGEINKSGKRIFTGIIRDITERKKAEKEIRRLNRDLERRVVERTGELQEANQQMEAFIYSIAHDLRAPLRGMRGFAQALRDDYATNLDDQAKDYASRIISSAKFMDDLINDLLSFSRITRAELEFVPVRLNSVLGEVREQLAHEIQEKNALIEVPAPLPHVIAHEPTLRQILTNLLSNSLKFTGPNVQPRIIIRAEDAGTYWRIWIEDNGIGISSQYRDRIFGIFERLHGGAYPGTGIGLAIVRKGIERMSGHVGVESELNQGSRFWFELPKAA